MALDGEGRPWKEALQLALSFLRHLLDRLRRLDPEVVQVVETKPETKYVNSLFQLLIQIQQQKL